MPTSSLACLYIFTCNRSLHFCLREKKAIMYLYTDFSMFVLFVNSTVGRVSYISYVISSSKHKAQQQRCLYPFFSFRETLASFSTRTRRNRHEKRKCWEREVKRVYIVDSGEKKKKSVKKAFLFSSRLKV